MLFFFFVNDFDVHRNMYKTLKAFYFILINLFYEKRRKLINVFILILKFYNAKIKNVIIVFIKVIKQLNRGVNFIINNNVDFVCFFLIEIIENMFEQARMSEFSHHNVKKNCRSCFCFKNKKKNFSFDVVKYNKYHFEIIK